MHLAKNTGGKTSGPPRRLLPKDRQKGLIVEVQSKREQRNVAPNSDSGEGELRSRKLCLQFRRPGTVIGKGR